MGSKFEIVVFNQNDLSLEVRVDKDADTVWLNTEEIARLFQVDRTGITRHINNIYKKGELEKNSTCAKNAHMGSLGKQTYNVNLYNLDVIISVGYKVNSKVGVQFRKWASSILKQYLIDGYAINNKRMLALNKTIEIQNKILANTLDVESNELKKIIDSYTDALMLLDSYDHQRVSKPKGNEATYVLEYDECREFINNMRFNNDSNVFGVEKEKGILKGIIASINQTAFGEEIYKSLEEKAANLLYFIVKDHPFVDGCKRIAAGLFLLYLSKNALLNKHSLTISNGALTAITLLVAESKPEEKEIMIRIIMNILFEEM